MSADYAVCTLLSRGMCLGGGQVTLHVPFWGARFFGNGASGGSNFTRAFCGSWFKELGYIGAGSRLAGHVPPLPLPR